MIITNVSDTPDVEEVLIGKLGVIHGVKKNAVIIDMSTIAPAASRRMAELFAKKNAFMLDAPVSGGEKGAIDGTLTFMVGGDARAFNKVKPILAAMGKTITRIGDAGAGQVAKACNQIHHRCDHLSRFRIFPLSASQRRGLRQSARGAFRRFCPKSGFGNSRQTHD